MSTYNDDLKLIEKEIRNSLAHLIDESRDRPKLMRSSGLPYCPLREFVEAAKADEDSPTGLIDIEGLFYTGVGTLVHELFQNWMPQRFEAVQILARWNPDSVGCVDTQCPHRSKYNIIAMHNQGCSRCGKHLEHEELESFSLFSSHTDQVYVIRGTKRAYICDIKTTSMSKMYAYNRGDFKIPPSYIFQTDSYVVQLYNLLIKLGYEICGTFILYIPRDQPRSLRPIPIRRRITKEWVEKKRARLYRIAEGWKVMSRVLQEEDFTLTAAKECANKKLCTSAKYYATKVEDKYNPCCVKDVCFDKQRLTEYLKKVLKERN